MLHREGEEAVGNSCDQIFLKLDPAVPRVYVESAYLIAPRRVLHFLLKKNQHFLELWGHRKRGYRF